MRLSLHDDSQREMREAYLDGAPGVLVSGLVWALAALVCWRVGVEQGIWALLLGGVAIHPIGTLLDKALGRSSEPPKGNGLFTLAFASTIWLIVGCAMAFGLSLHDRAWFFPAMLATIGCRYMVFSTLYGRAIYWVFGAVLVAAGVITFRLAVPPMQSAALGSLIEIGFAVAIWSSAEPQAAT